jgi:hypothetical protein
MGDSSAVKKKARCFLRARGTKFAVLENERLSTTTAAATTATATLGCHSYSQLLKVIDE